LVDIKINRNTMVPIGGFCITFYIEALQALHSMLHNIDPQQHEHSTQACISLQTSGSEIKNCFPYKLGFTGLCCI